MFQNLSQKLTSIFDNLRGRGFISEDDLNIALRQIRIALIEADVSLSVVKDFIEQVRTKAIGQAVVKSVSSGQMIIKIVQDHLIDLLKGSDESAAALNLAARPPASILMVGLQGSGKTTSTGKLAKYLNEQLRKRVLMVSLDVYRPAAQHQLEVLANSLGIESLSIVDQEKPLQIVKRAMERAKQGSFDVVLYDTAGRLHIDETLMDEVKTVHQMIDPIETLLVADAMTGQDAVSIAKGFMAAVPLTGLILTRIDGDSRGGAALSMRAVTGCPIKFLGIGEKSDQLELFDANRVADRILDMGDIVALVEKAATLQITEETNQSMLRMQKGLFDLNDMAEQLKQMLTMGGLSGIMGMLPGAGKIKNHMKEAGVDDRLIRQQLAIIQSMTIKERRSPGLLNASRKRRIAAGAGVHVSFINKLLKQHEQMQKVMKQMKINPKGMMSKLGGALSHFMK